MKALDLSGKMQPSLELLLYDSLAEQARADFMEKGQLLIDLYDQYASKTKAAFPDEWIELCRWNSFLTVYDCLLNSNSAWLDSVLKHYHEKIASAQAELDRKSKDERVRRDRAIKDFLAIRPISIDWFELHETSFIEDCIKSFAAAKQRSPQYFQP
jgi:hypothetical protein